MSGMSTPSLEKPRREDAAANRCPTCGGQALHGDFQCLLVRGGRLDHFRIPGEGDQADLGAGLLALDERQGGGGIRVTEPGEDACTVPYVQVANVQTTFNKAIRAGAEEVIAPNRIMDDLVIACVRAPGGVAIGFAGPK